MLSPRISSLWILHAPRTQAIVSKCIKSKIEILSEVGCRLDVDLNVLHSRYRNYLPNEIEKK